MRETNILATICVMGATASMALAAPALSVSHDPSPLAFDAQLSTNDLAAGLIAVEKVTGDGLYPSLEYTNGIGVPMNDNGYHPANPASANSLHPFGLPTFTNGVGPQSTLDGLLNDFPGDAAPTKRLVYDLGGAFDIGQINILGGNANDPDGRAFVTTIIRVSTDGGNTWTDLEGNGGTVVYDAKPFVDSGLVPVDGAPFPIPNGSYFQSDPTGTVNDAAGNNWMSTFMQITDDASPVLAAGVTHVNVEFYSVHHTDNIIEDPFFGVNPFTGIDDNIGSAGAADFNDDQVIDLNDFNILALNFGTLVGATKADGDADGDGDVDIDDRTVLANLFGNTGGLRMSNPDQPWPIVSSEIWEIDILEAPAAATVPEPATAALFALAGVALLRRRA
jgi:hypothetical protein